MATHPTRVSDLDSTDRFDVSTDLIRARNQAEVNDLAAALSEFFGMRGITISEREIQSQQDNRFDGALIRDKIREVDRCIADVNGGYSTAFSMGTSIGTIPNAVKKAQNPRTFENLQSDLTQIQPHLGRIYAKYIQALTVNLHEFLNTPDADSIYPSGEEIKLLATRILSSSNYYAHNPQAGANTNFQETVKRALNEHLHTKVFSKNLGFPIDLSADQLNGINNDRYNNAASALRTAVEEKMRDELVPAVETFLKTDRGTNVLLALGISPFTIYSITALMNDRVEPSFGALVGTFGAMFLSQALAQGITMKSREKAAESVGAMGQQIVGPYLVTNADTTSGNHTERMGNLMKVLPQEPLSVMRDAGRASIFMSRIKVAVLALSAVSPIAWDKLVTEPRDKAMMERINNAAAKAADTFTQTTARATDDQLAHIKIPAHEVTKKVPIGNDTLMYPSFILGNDDCEPRFSTSIENDSGSYNSPLYVAPELSTGNHTVWIMSGAENQIIISTGMQTNFSSDEKTDCFNRTQEPVVILHVRSDGKGGYKTASHQNAFIDRQSGRVQPVILKASELNARDHNETYDQELDSNPKINEQIQRIFSALNTPPTEKSNSAQRKKNSKSRK